jgi:hypothetical protein
MRTPGPEDEPRFETAFFLEEFLSSARWLRRRENFYERALGPPAVPGVFHWQDDHDPHIDVYAHGPTADRAFDVLVTGGMADRPQPGVSFGDPRPRRVELLLPVVHPGTWAAPILREIASLPFAYDTVLEEGHLIQGNGPVRKGSELCNAVIRRAETDGWADLGGFIVEGDVVEFLIPCFVTEEELRVGVGAGGRRLIEELEAAGIGPVLDPGRKCVLGR